VGWERAQASDTAATVVPVVEIDEPPAPESEAVLGGMSDAEVITAAEGLLVDGTHGLWELACLRRSLPANAGPDQPALFSKEVVAAVLTALASPHTDAVEFALAALWALMPFAGMLPAAAALRISHNRCRSNLPLRVYCASAFCYDTPFCKPGPLISAPSFHQGVRDAKRTHSVSLRMQRCDMMPTLHHTAPRPDIHAEAPGVVVLFCCPTHAEHRKQMVAQGGAKLLLTVLQPTYDPVDGVSADVASLLTATSAVGGEEARLRRQRMALRCMAVLACDGGYRTALKALDRRLSLLLDLMATPPTPMEWTWLEGGHTLNAVAAAQVRAVMLLPAPSSALTLPSQRPAGVLA
jgi:hypothetical protein